MTIDMQARNRAALDRVSATLQKYLQANKRNARDLIRKKAGDIAIKLYQFCQEGAPTKAQIAAKVRSLGWRVKRKPGKWPARKGQTAKQAMERMQAVQIAKRASAIGFVASGWLPAVRVLRGTGAARRKTLRPVKNPRGSVQFVGMESDKPTVVLTNRTPGIFFVMEKTDAFGKALDASAADMQAYIDRKESEAWKEAHG